MNIYYVYFYLRSKESKNGKLGTPYYVGKGKGNRYKADHRIHKIPKDKSKIIFVKENLTELQALALERYYIRWFGRIDNNTGILHNKTDGGEGCSGVVVSETTKLKQSKTHKKRYEDPKEREKTKIATKQALEDPKEREKISLRTKGKKGWNNGVTYIMSYECPGNDFVRGTLEHQKPPKAPWWNNGVVNRRSESSPGPDFVRGKLFSEKCAKKHTGKYWWNNGVVAKFVTECPGEGFIKGRLTGKESR